MAGIEGTLNDEAFESTLEQGVTYGEAEGPTGQIDRGDNSAILDGDQTWVP